MGAKKGRKAGSRKAGAKPGKSVKPVKPETE